MSTSAARTESAEPSPAVEAGRLRGELAYGPLRQRLGYLLRRAQIAVFQDFFALFEKVDIRPAQYSILTIVECNPGLSQTRVSEALAIKKTNLVAMIDVLEARGFLRRAEAPNDRRSYALFLTEEGRKLMGTLHKIAAQHEQRIIDRIGADAYAQLQAPLEALANLSAGRDEQA